MTCGIYFISNLINNKIYVGQSINIEKRWIQHKRELRNNIHENKRLQNAWNKYKEENFEFSIACECEEKQLNTLEQYYIFSLESYLPKGGYNISLGGDGLFIKGVNNKMNKSVYCIETKTEYFSIAEASRQTGIRETSILQCCKGNYKYAGKEGKQKFHWMYYEDFLEKGEIIDNAPRKKIEKGHQVICLETEEVFESLKIAGEKYNIDGSNIGACCRGKRTTAGEYHWMYYEDYLSGKVIEMIPNYVPPTKKRKVYCPELNLTFDSIQEASDYTGDLKSKICCCCKGTRKTTNKHHWQYID
jgi:group I intron endonuclease